MARGYLGKISAVISANNGEYIRALDQSKQATRNFASTVTRDLRAATRDASKSLEGILTPLQRFDRALKAAVSQRLSFRGFEGAIRTFKDLEKTIGNLSDREVRIALRASGFREIEQLRTAVAGLQQTDVDLFVNLVGKDATTNDLRRLIATANQADGKVIGLKAQVNVAEAQRLIETFESRGIASTRRIRRAIESLNEFRAEGAATALRGIVSVAEQIGRPVAAAAAQLGGLSLEVQAQLVPALARAQDGVGKLERDIDAKLPIAERRFEGVRRAAESAAQAISRAAEASKLAASGATGNELGFVAPRVRNELQANAAARNRVAESADPSRFRSEVQELDRIGQSIERINASIERRRILGLDTAEAERNLSRVLERSQQVRASIRGAQEFSVIPGNAVGEFGPTGVGPNTPIDPNRFRNIERDRAARSAGSTESLIKREQDAKRLADQIAAVSERAAQTEIDALIQREQRAKRLAGQLNAAAERTAQAELDALIQREQRQKRLATQLAAAAEQAAQAELEALIQREQRQKRLATQIAAAADRAAQAEVDALIQREQRARRLADQVADQDPAQRVIRQRRDEELVRQRREDELAAAQGSRTDLGAGRARGRILGELGGEIAVVRRQLGELPDLAASLGPQVDGLTTRFQNLARAGVAFTAEQVRQLRGEVTAVSEAIQSRRGIGDQFLAGAGGRGEAGLQLGIDQRQLQGAAGEIEFLQGRLQGLTAEARGPAVAAIERYRQAIVTAFRNGSIATEQGRQTIQAAREEVVRLTAAATNVRVDRLGDQLRRAGDIGRGGFGNIQLAVQQAAFAVDDFFSVTGDLSQRLRAAGNNISQLGFILGSTEGLIAGIAFSISAQLVAALIRWSNDGRTAEIQTQALTDALARQKSLVEQLAQAFSALGDSIARSAFSGRGAEARAFGRELDEIAKKQRELRDAQAFALDPGVLQARADVRVAENRLGQARNRDEAVEAQRQLARARARLAGEEDRVRNRPDLDAGAVRDNAVRAFEAAVARFGEQAGGLPVGLPEFERVRRIANELGGVQDPAELARILRVEQQAAEQRGDRALVADIEQLLQQLEDPIRRAADNLVRQLFQAADRAAKEIGLAQGRVADAIGAGVPGALQLRTTLDRLAEVIDGAAKEIADAQEEFANSNQTPEAAARRDERIRTARGRLERSRAEREAAQERAREIDFSRTVDPQKFFPAILDRVGANLGDAQATQGLLARRQRELEARRRQLLQDADSENPFVRRRAARGLEELDAQARALETATSRLASFSEALNRAAQEVQGNLQNARQREDAARRRSLLTSDDDAAGRFFGLKFGLRFPETQAVAQRRRAERAREEQQKLAREAEEVFNNERARLEREAEAGRGPLAGDFARRRQIEDELASGDFAGADGARRRRALEEERRQINQRIDEAVEASPAVRDARNRSTLADERAASAERGARLSQTPAERAALEIGDNLRDIRNDFDERRKALADDGAEPEDFAQLERDRQEALRRELERGLRQQAPLAFQFADEIANAVLQGPSRAALGATDASTTQGQAELNRLIRGQDSARDVNLVELEKQTQVLTEIKDLLPFPVAGA
jgi:hypothetical protein